MRLLVGTKDGLHELPAQSGTHFGGQEVTALATRRLEAWAIVGGGPVWHFEGHSWNQVASVEGLQATCLLPSTLGLLVGTSEAHLLHLRAGVLERVTSFDSVDSRDNWYTPWGGPPDTRSLAQDVGGSLYVNVHVGGVILSRDAGASWRPSGLNLHVDVHQVLSPDRSLVLVAAGDGGLGVSRDGGETWAMYTAGLHANYCRAVAVSEGVVLLSASTGPRTRQAAIYRRPLNGNGLFQRCERGLPEWFPNNVDTGCLVASGPTVALGSTDGTVFFSADQGETWEMVASGLPPVTCVAIS